MECAVSACAGGYRAGIRVHPVTGAAECPVCGRRFDRNQMAGEFKVNVPMHSPRLKDNTERWPL